MVTSQKINGGSLNVTVFGKNIFADTIKDLQMRLSWMTEVGPKDECLHRVRQGDEETAM